MDIINAFFCDRCEIGQFGKINVYGWITSEHITVDSTPYNFISNLVISGKTEKEVDVEGLEVKVKFSKKDGSLAWEITSPFKSGLTRQTGIPPFPVFLVFPVTFEIPSPGEMNIQVLKNGSKLYQVDYSFIHGKSPNIKMPGHIPQAKTFSGDNLGDTVLLKNLIASASKTLKIIDAYMDPSTLKNLLLATDPSVEATLITFSRNLKIRNESSTLKSSFPKLEIKYTAEPLKESHDRFVIINDSEFFHFGHSLGGIAAGKVSRYSKMVNQLEIEDFLQLLQTIESGATT